MKIRAAIQESEVGKFIEEADALMTIRISDDLLKKAKKLKWIHAMTIGVDYLINLPSGTAINPTVKVWSPLKGCR